MVSFIHQEKIEKKEKYEDFENRRVERGLWTMALKGYVNTVFGGRALSREYADCLLISRFRNGTVATCESFNIKLQIGNAMASKLLVDGGSSSNILL